ncbi:MAG: low affinity iron permease family protein [Methylocella sp.]
MVADKLFADLSSKVAKASGRPLTIVVSAIFVIVWACAGPFFRFSDTWQLIMNTVSSTVTFLMVFLIENTQARNGQAVQAKLDEIIKALDKADNRYMQIERLPDEAIERFREQHNRPEAPKQPPSPALAID